MFYDRQFESDPWHYLIDLAALEAHEVPWTSKEHDP